MKYILNVVFFLGWLLISQNVYSQSGIQEIEVQELSNKLKSTEAEIINLKKKIDEKHYTRIPNRDFDEIVNSKISKTISEKFNVLFTLMGVLVGFFALVGSIFAFLTRRYLNAELDKNVKSKIKTVENELKLFITSELKNIENYIEGSKRVLYATEFEQIKNEAEFKPYSGKILGGLQNLLAKADEIKDEALVPKIIDELIVFFLNGNELEEIEKLFDSYSKNYKFLESSWVNTAVVYIMDYETFGAKQQRDKAMECLKKSLDKLPAYGEALGLELLIFMIDYDRASSEEEKEKSKNDSLTLIREINAGYNNLGSYETINTIRRDRDDKVFSKYVKLLYKLFPDDLGEMEKRAQKYQEKLGQKK